MLSLQPAQRDEFRVCESVTDGTVPDEEVTKVDVSDPELSTEDEFQCVDVCYGSDIDATMIHSLERNQPANTQLYEAFDSHFHLDRTCARIWNDPRKSVEDLLNYTGSGIGRPNLDVNVTGGVIVYSEPPLHPDSVSASPWGVAVGVHPKHFNELTTGILRHMEELLCSPSVVALGEVGLDRTIPIRLWRRQEEAFRKVLTIVRKDKVLVIHLRGTPSDRIGMDVHARCMQILQKTCDPDQPIHLHCFMGDPELAKEWLDGFSNVHFGFTGAVANFSEEQIAGLKSIPMNRILLETDSPYMKPGGGSINTPAFIGDVATQVASKLGVALQYLLKETVRNGRRLYKIEPMTEL
jgi:TatD DNase family protein